MNIQIPFVDLRAQYESVKEEIRTAWDEALDSMQLFLGPNTQAFEREFSAYCGTSEAIGVSDGTTALHIALRACNVGPGDEVITVAHTFMATVEAILLIGAVPVFVDIDHHTFTMDVHQIESKITPRTKAILPVHIYGQCADMDPILEIAEKHGLVVIEDACQAHGATYKGKRAGSMGTAAAFSFYFSKNLGAYGEGGMVTTNDAEVARRLRSLRNHGSETRYYHDELGINGRLDELQAAVLRIKLRHLESWNAQRRENAGLYNLALQGCDLIRPVAFLENQHVYHLYVIRVEARDELRDSLTAKGIGTGVHYPVPAHLQKPCLGLGYRRGSLPVTEAIVKEILSLPMYAELTGEQIEQVAGEIRSFQKKTSLQRKPRLHAGSSVSVFNNRGIK